MFTTDLLAAERIRLDLDAGSKKRVLEEIATLLQGGEDEDLNSIFDHLLERERLGSTGMGHGVALPHARMPGLVQARGGFIRLASPVDYGAIDGEPVDLVFGLLVPGQATQEHLQLLASLASLFHDTAVCQRLRSASDPHEILNTLLTA